MWCTHVDKCSEEVVWCTYRQMFQGGGVVHLCRQCLEEVVQCTHVDKCLEQVVWCTHVDKCSEEVVW